MDEQIQALLQHLKGIWRRRWLALGVAWLVCIAGWAWVYTLPDRYEASARVYVDTQTLLKPLLKGLTAEPDVSQQIELMTRTLISRPNLEKVARMTDLDVRAKTAEDMEALLAGLSESIHLGAAGKTNLYTIAYENENPDLAKRVVQALLTIFVESSLGNTRKDIASSQKFIDDQLKLYEQKLIEQENRLKEFRRANMGLLPGEGGTGYFAKMSSVRDELRAAELELTQARGRRDQLKRQLEDEEPEIQAAVSATSSASTELDGRISALKKKLDDMLLAFTDKHPDVLATRRLLARLEEQKKQEAKDAASSGVTTGAKATNPVYQQLTVSIAEAEAMAASMEARVSEYNRRLAELARSSNMVPEVEAQLTQLTRDYDVYKKNYQELLERRESAAIAGDVESKADTVDFRIVDPPRVPLDPSWPNRPLFITMVLLAGLVAGMGIAFGLHAMRRTVVDRRALKNLTGLPILGQVSLVLSPEQTRKRRVQFFAFMASVGSLVTAYALLIGMTLFLARAS